MMALVLVLLGAMGLDGVDLLHRTRGIVGGNGVL